MDKVSDNLRAARDLLAEPGAWIQGNYAHNERHQAVHPDDPTAIGWCSLGALAKVMNLGDQTIQVGLSAEASVLRMHTPYYSIPDWNDEQRDVEPVLLAFDLAIKDADERGE